MRFMLWFQMSLVFGSPALLVIMHLLIAPNIPLHRLINIFSISHATQNNTMTINANNAYLGTDTPANGEL